MGLFSKFEGKMEDTFEGAANKMFDAPISPVQIAKKAEKQMRREKMVGAGKQYAPTLYTVLVNPDDDERLFGYYPTLAGETETYLSAKAGQEGLVMDGQPLVRFIVDDGLKRGKFDIIAEPVAAPIIEQLRAEEMHRYGIGPAPQNNYAAPAPAPAAAPMDFPRNSEFDVTPGFGDYGYDAPAADPYGQQNNKEQLPYVPENEIDYSIDYGEYTFNSQDFDNYSNAPSQPLPDRNQGFNNNEVVDEFGFNAPFGQEYENSNPAYPNNAGAGSIPGSVAGGHAAGVPGAAAGNPAAGIPGAGAAIPGTPAGAAGYPGGGMPQQAPHQAAPQQSVSPDTVVFAAGAGNANPTPNNALVRARLINTTENRTYDLATSRLIMGRDNKNNIVLSDINASRTHAEIRFEPQGIWTITDLGSTNGTTVNGNRITTQPLSNGDRITIGMTNFIFSTT